MAANNEEECLYQLMACVYKHNGRLDVTTIRNALSDKATSAFKKRIPDFIFFSQNDIDEFKKSCGNAGFNGETRYSSRYIVSKTSTIVCSAFEQLKNEYKGDLESVKLINGQYQVQVTFSFKADVRLERSVFRSPFIETKHEWLTKKPLNPEYVSNLNSNRLTIDWNALFENYTKFETIERAIKEFYTTAEYYRPSGYDIYNNTQFIGKSGYEPIVEAELKAHITSKAPKEEYTIEQAKNDVETCRKTLEQCMTLLQKATERLVK